MKARSFESDVADWNVSSGQNFQSLFRYCGNFNSDISEWNVCEATDMIYMFGDAKDFNQNLSKWTTPKISFKPIILMLTLDSKVKPTNNRNGEQPVELHLHH